MKYSLFVERVSLRGTVDFHDTGRTFEAADAASAHDAVMAEQVKDGRSYSAVPAQEGVMAAAGRVIRRLF